MNYFKHQLSQVESDSIGKNTKIWQFSIVLKGAVIGENCNICSHCFIENEVSIGDNVTIKAGVYLWNGIHIKDNVFIGPNVVFTNDAFPRSKNFKEPERIIIEEGVSLGANSTILAGVKLGKYAMTGIGSVVTRNLKSHGLYYGNPAKQSGWIDEQGEKLEFDLQNKVWLSKNKSIYIESPDGLTNVESVVK